MADSKIVPVKSNDQGTIGFEIEPPDSRLENGPIPERTCTDSCCYFIFVFFTVAMFAIELTGFAEGDPTRLATTFDYNSKLFRF